MVLLGFRQCQDNITFVMSVPVYRLIIYPFIPPPLNLPNCVIKTKEHQASDERGRGGGNFYAFTYLRKTHPTLARGLGCFAF